MIGLDTNVILRCFIDDEPSQAKAARRFVAEHCTQENPGFIDRVALCELIWVLSSGYRFDRKRTATVITTLLASHDIVFEDDNAVRAPLQIFVARNSDFADALIGEVNRLHGCDATATFDRKAAKLDGFILVS